MEKGAAPRVRQIGQMIASQHVWLDLLASNAATEVRGDLPNVPTTEQRRRLDEMKDASGTAFDTVRKLARSTNAFVLTHLTLLESTGLVDYAELPRAVAPAVGPIAKAEDRKAQEGGSATGLIAGSGLRRPDHPATGFRRSTPEARATWLGVSERIPVQPADNFSPEEGLRLSRGSRSFPDLPI